ncbi:hypothetical protein H2203_007330 [Taxawa tesnikishii (nom. ined.)]|nr:hypothetical protein H2203_007330 [Dothideales sp. JES 119]
MASLPPRPASQRRSSPSSPPPPPQLRPAPAVTPRICRIQADHRIHTERRLRHQKCWICLLDETDDTPESSEWRDPCPCALVAHEDCLLDWIADTESPSTRRRTTISRPQILCPQCKTEIKLARPRSVVVEGVRAMERLFAKLAIPGAVLATFGGVLSACNVHGMHTIYSIFGPDDGRRILRPVLEEFEMVRTISLENWRADFAEIVREQLIHWRLRVGLPLITPMLILSRTRIMDSVLPVLPIVFFATQGDADTPLDFGHWPPSASLAMAVLPYVRGAYNAYYDRVWAAREKQWSRAIKPRLGSSGTGDDNAVDAGNADEADQPDQVEDDHVFEIRLDGDMWEQWDANAEVEFMEDDAPDANDNGPQQQPPQQERPGDRQQEAERAREEMRREGLLGDEAAAAPQAHPFNAPPLDTPGPRPEHEPAPAPQVPLHNHHADPAQPQAHVHNHNERRISLSPTSLAQTVLGALFFPAIASASGQLLAAVLPQSWTRPSAGKPPTGLLQTQWGRSLVGGSLFVVVKDAVMLYVRWKMAQQHRKRRVLDYPKKKRV